jgi:hypothetical protein
MLVLQFDALWDNDRFQPAAIDRYVARLRGLRPETAEKWKEQLNRIIEPLGDGVDDLEIVGLLVQVDRVFPDDRFNQRESEILLARLRSVDPKAIEVWKKTSNSYSSQAAIELIQNDGLFHKGLFQSQRFDEALRSLEASTSNGKRP